MGCCPQAFLFGHPKRKRKRCPLLPIAREARPRGYSPLGTPKRRSKKQKAKTCRSAARFLTLFTSSPIDPSGAKFHSTTYPVGADACHRPAQAGTYLRAGRRGGFNIRPQYTRNHRGVGDAAPYTQPYGACTGKHCSPLRSLNHRSCREGSCPLRGMLSLLQLCAAANFPLKPPHFTQTLQNLYASLLVKYPLTKL